MFLSLEAMNERDLFWLFFIISTANWILFLCFFISCGFNTLPPKEIISFII